MIDDCLVIEDALLAVIQGEDVWKNDAYRRDAVAMLKEALLGWLQDAESRAAEFGRVEQADHLRLMSNKIKRLP